MQPLPALSRSEEKQVAGALAQLLDQAQRRAPRPLGVELLQVQPGRRAPLWLHVCHAVMSQDALQPEWRPALQALVLGGGLRFAGLADLPELPAGTAPLLPAEVALCAQPGHAPQTLEQALLVRWFNGDRELHVDPALDLTQLLVRHGMPVHEPGLLARLELWCVHEPGLGPAGRRRLARAPGAALLPVDEPFAAGLQAVQQVLDAWVLPDAPVVAWGLRALPELGQQREPVLANVGGTSASAALALGALWLLRRHLRPGLEPLAEALCDLEAHQLEHASITAELGAWPLGSGDAGNTGPALVPIGGADDKFSVLARLPSRRPKPHLFVASRQDSHGRLPASQVTKVPHLLGLADEVALKLGSGLEGPARRLHALLVQDDEPVQDMRLLRQVAEQPTRARTLKHYLVRRYAHRATGAHRAFADPVRLDQHFVQLQLEPEADPNADSAGGGASGSAKPEPPVELRHLLQAQHLRQATAWCIDAAPFHGKTTLLARWELQCAREALRRHQEAAGHWGEVCVFLPMRRLHPPPLPERATQAQRQKVLAEFQRFIAEQADGLALLPPAAEPGGPAGHPVHPVHPGLQLRLLADGLNELPARSLEERRRVVQLLFGWMATQPGLMPPVLTVRTREDGLTLVAEANDRLRARRAHILPWGREQWRQYVALRSDVPAPAAQRLLEDLRAQEPGKEPEGGDTAFEQFCSSPGILAAQCTLLARWPNGEPPRRSGPLFMALLWHCLAERGGPLAEALLPARLRGDAALQQAQAAGWAWPQAPGPLLEHLALQACAMQDAPGGPLEEVPAAAVPAGLKPRDRAAWLQAARTLGLVEQRGLDDLFAFVHPQWREFFAALGLQPAGPLPPGIEPPALNPPDEAGLLRSLQERGGRLRLPNVSPQTERLRMAADTASLPTLKAWLRRLLRVNLPMAARLAADHLLRLEPQGPWRQQGSTPTMEVQHLRRLLLLRCMDAGSAVLARLQAGAVLGPDAAQAALAEHMPGYDGELDTHWREAWAGKCQGAGVDIRLRLEAGALLGELGDNLRYMVVAAPLADGSTRTGLVPRPEQWAMLGEPGGPPTAYPIGDDQGRRHNEKPAWQKLLPAFQMARYPVTVAEWRWFVEGGGYNPEAPWWQGADEGVREWLASELKQRAAELTAFMANASRSLEPIARVTWFECMGYAAWAQPLHIAACAGAAGATTKPAGPAWQTRLPTELQWEAGVRGPWQKAEGEPPQWSGLARGSEPGPLTFNHFFTRLLQRSPVGAFSAGSTGHGVFEAAGNVWEWCESVSDGRTGWEPQARTLADKRTGLMNIGAYRALRGGSHVNAATYCRVAYRYLSQPSSGYDVIGVRLVRE